MGTHQGLSLCLRSIAESLGLPLLRLMALGAVIFPGRRLCTARVNRRGKQADHKHLASSPSPSAKGGSLGVCVVPGLLDIIVW